MNKHLSILLVCVTCLIAGFLFVRSAMLSGYEASIAGLTAVVEAAENLQFERTGSHLMLNLNKPVNEAAVDPALAKDLKQFSGYYCTTEVLSNKVKLIITSRRAKLLFYSPRTNYILISR